MELKLLKSDIVSNNIPKFLIFNVEEPVLAKQYIQQMSSTLGKYYKYYDTIDEVLYETSTNLREDFLYVILNCDIKNINQIEDLIKSNRHIILYLTSLDTKLEWYKKYKDFVVNFSHLDKYTIVAYLLKQLSLNRIIIDQDKIENLVDFCNCNFSLCVNELSKIITLNQDNSNILMDYMFNKGFSDYRKTNVFSFIQKILNKDKSLFEEISRLDDSIISIITILYNQAKNRLIKYNNNFYANIMQLCVELDCGIKDGTVNAESALDYLLMEVFSE